MRRFLGKASDWLGVSNSFALANIFAFSMSGSAVSLSIAIITGFFSWRAEVYAQCVTQNAPARFDYRLFETLRRWLLSDKNAITHLSLRLVAIGTALSAITAGVDAGIHGHWEEALFPVLAGCSFSIGNWLGASSYIHDIQVGERRASGVIKCITNPAVYYGVGYVNLGLLAGGGFVLFTAPLSNIPAFLSTMFSVLATATSIIGLLIGQVKNPAPFMFVAHGTAFNALSGIFTMNPLAFFNNAFACHGETRLGWILREPEQQASFARQHDAEVFDTFGGGTEDDFSRAVNAYFRGMTYVACWPIRLFGRL